MAYHSLWIHIVWGTKHRFPYLAEENLLLILNHIRETARLKGIIIDRINGWDDHIHVLLRLHPDQNIAAILLHLKGESSYWATKTGLIRSGPLWAKEYYAASVSGNRVSTIRRYIDNQKMHHSHSAPNPDL